MRDYSHIKREMDFSLYTDILYNKTKEDIREAYKIVFADMMNDGCGLLVGKYDARNGSNKFMYGIMTVMDYITGNISEILSKAFEDEFYKNLEESRVRAVEQKDNKS